MVSLYQRGDWPRKFAAKELDAVTPLLMPAARALAYDVVNRLPYGRKLFDVFVGDLQSELVLERHDQLDGVQGVRAEIVSDRSIRRHRFLLHSKLADDHGNHTGCNAAHQSAAAAATSRTTPLTASTCKKRSTALKTRSATSCADGSA